MFQFEFPEFLLLAIPLLVAAHRFGGLRVDWRWLTPLVVWVPAALYFRWPWWSHLWIVLPVWLSLRSWLREAGVTGGLRLAIAALLLISLTGPAWNLGGHGVDVILVVDRSRSMPADVRRGMPELIANVENARRAGDRVGLVTFGSHAVVEYDLSDDAELTSFQKEILPDGSDLNDALLTALNQVDGNRPARILVLSDGEANGQLPTMAARRAREMGVPIDFRAFERPRIGDAALQAVDLPEEVSPREPFQFSVEVFADRDVTGRTVVRRDGNVIASQETEFFAGSNRVSYRDLVETPGLHTYTVDLEIEGDPLPENNTAAGLVRVNAGPRVLVLNADGQAGNLVNALRSAQIPVDVAVASEHPLTQDSLDVYRTVIIENVPAGDFGRLKMERLAQFVEDLGGGLLLTGGRRSFGTGGYFNSPLEEVLPVSMELREEHRKTRVAIAIALDRSGSMTAPVHGGKTKMDLANLGTAECVRLLSSGDSVAVIAVDSSPHTIQPLVDVSDKEAIARKVLRIESMGGGIFVHTALVAAGNELMKANQATRHIILFSDAADSEEPGNYTALLKQYEDAGITVSVIGLGTNRDVDARLLEDIAKLGRGNIMFTEDAEELPRLFTEDTMSVARSSFIEKDPATQPAGIPGALLPDARLMGELLGEGGDTARAFPTADGYNLSYLRPDATAAVVSQDEYLAPWSAFWNRGLGRTAAITLEVDGRFSGSFGRWENFEDFLITHARWLLGDATSRDVYTDLERQGQDAVVTVELDPERPDRGSGNAPQLVVVPPGDDRVERIEPDFTWVGPDTLEARFRMERTGSYRTLVVDRKADSADTQIARGPAVTLPYSPEFDPREGLLSGAAILSEVAALSGGEPRTSLIDVFRDPPRSARTTSLLPWLLSAAVLLLLMEIVGRRLSLWDQVAEKVRAAVPSTLAPSQWLPRWEIPKRTRRKGPKKQVVDEPAQPEPSSQGPDPAQKGAAPTKPAAEAKPDIDVFAAAKQRAKRRNQ